MERIIAFECDFCKKILKTKQAMKTHEPKCFKNPTSKSCITCKNLSHRNFIGDIQLTDKEELILQFEVDGTYHTCTGHEEANYNELNSEYKYLENAEPESYCLARAKKLTKLKTNCIYHI